MICKKQIAILPLLLCAIVLNGCEAINGIGGKKVKFKEVKSIPTEEQKTKLRRKIEKKFTDSESHFQLGQLYHRDGLWTKAEYEYNTALSFDPVHRRTQAAMVKVLVDSGGVSKSQIYADIYMNQASNSADGTLLLGMAFQKEELDDYALTCYRKALQLAPNSAKINKLIGYYYLAKNDKIRAQDYLVRSFQLDPRQPEVSGELGRLGVQVKVPRKINKNVKKLDKIVEKSEKQ